MSDSPSLYPLREQAAETLRAASGRPLDALTEAALDAGELSIADTQVSAETLRAQAEVAHQAGHPQLAANLRRAAELVAVPNPDVLRMYDLLRPGRASYDQLVALTDELATRYAASACAAFVREAAEVYLRRGLCKRG
jgi:propanediol dehydratase small subunit